MYAKSLVIFVLLLVSNLVLAEDCLYEEKPYAPGTVIAGFICTDAGIWQTED